MGYMFREAEYRASNIFSIEIPAEANGNDIKEHFNEKKISVSFRGDSIRVTPNVYNEKADLDNLVQCLRDLL